MSGKGGTSARGYGWQHQKARKAALASFVPGQPCVRCNKPMTSRAGLELDHDDDDRSRYNGLAHAECNRRAGGQKAQRQRAEGPLLGWPPTAARAWSRDWENDWTGEGR